MTATPKLQTVAPTCTCQAGALWRRGACNLQWGADGFEECDDGNDEAGDGCSPTCLREICGNGIVDEGEACDDGNRSDLDACTNACAWARCGTTGSCEKTWRPMRRVSKAATTVTTTRRTRCSAICGVEICGNGIVDPNDACDDEQINTGTCTNNCEVARCGDAVLARWLAQDAPGYEACDDGNAENTDGC